MSTSPDVEAWKKEAEIELVRKYLLRALVLRYGEPPPDDLTSKIEETTDLDTLQWAFNMSQMAGTLFTFRMAARL